MKRTFQRSVAIYFFILSFYCAEGITDKKIHNSGDTLSIKSDLERRGYDIEIVNDKKGFDSYVTVDQNAEIRDADFEEICKLPFLRKIKYHSNQFSANFVNDILKCKLSELHSLNFKSSAFKEEILCSLSKEKGFNGRLTLSNVNITDVGLNCIAKFHFLQSLSISEPQGAFGDTDLCLLGKSNFEVKSIYFRNTKLSDSNFECLTELKGVETFGFKKIKGRTALDMKKLEALYFKKNGRRVDVDVFEYDSP